MQYLVYIAIAIAAYLIGSVNFSILLSRAVSGEDIRKSGSGNAGATNMLRTHGKKMAALTLILDIVKGIVAVLLAWYVANLLKDPVQTVLEGATRASLDPLDKFDAMTFGDATTFTYTAKYLAAVAVVVGHNFPIFFDFKGGKGVATSLGVVMLLDWRIGLIVAVVAITIIAITRYVSLGSIIGGALFIILEIVNIFFGWKCSLAQIIYVLILGLLLIGRHHANITRLIQGTENKLSMGKKKKETNNEG